MATVTSYTAEKIDALTDGAFTGGYISAEGNLVLVAQDTTSVVVGSIMDGVPEATDTVTGSVELATLAEVATGTDTVRAVTPAGVTSAVSSKLDKIKVYGGSSYGASNGLIYVGTADPGSVVDGSIWFDTSVTG